MTPLTHFHGMRLLQQGSSMPVSPASACPVAEPLQADGPKVSLSHSLSLSHSFLFVVVLQTSRDDLGSQVAE